MSLAVRISWGRSGWMDGDKKTRRVRSLLVRLFGVFIELYFGITLIVFTSKSPHELLVF